MVFSPIIAVVCNKRIEYLSVQSARGRKTRIRARAKFQISKPAQPNRMTKRAFSVSKPDQCALAD